jgi:hypothetical protein
MTENDIAPQKVYCKNCRHYREEVSVPEYGCSAHCAYTEYNLFNHELSLRGKLSDNDEGNCPHYTPLPIKQSFWKSLFNRE